ncbi:MAG: hypothetical protein KJZ84_23080 [Bryobacteraceae bacterium]|nr:hypothetical protein [Bryobacteraceae bacterium]
MKKTSASSFILICLVSGVLSGQSPDRAGFLIDADRPFVDIVFDRTGPWIPVFDGESSHGLWLTLRNNCAYPIMVDTITGPKQNGVLLVHEIREVIGGFPHPPSDSRVPPPLSNTYRGRDIRNSMQVLPGRTLQFGMPIEHITRSTWVRIEFDILFPKRPSGRQPRMYLDYYWIDLPKEAQALSEQVTSALKAK